MNFMKAAADKRQEDKNAADKRETARYDAVKSIRHDLIEYYDQSPGHQMYVDFATRDNGAIDCKYGAKEFTIVALGPEEFTLKTSEEAPNLFHNKTDLGLGILEFLSSKSL